MPERPSPLTTEPSLHTGPEAQARPEMTEGEAAKSRKEINEGDTVEGYFTSTLGDELFKYVQGVRDRRALPITGDLAEHDEEFVAATTEALLGLCSENVRDMVLTELQRKLISKGVSEAVTIPGKWKSPVYDTSKFFMIASYLETVSRRA